MSQYLVLLSIYLSIRVIKNKGNFFTRKEKSFFTVCFYKKSTLHCLKLVYSKNNLNLEKYCFAAIDDDYKLNRVHHTLEHRSLIKILVTKKCKQSAVYRRMYEVQGEANFREKCFTNGQNMVVPQRACVEKIVRKLETQWHSGKVKVLGAAVREEAYVEGLGWYERTRQYWFPWK